VRADEARERAHPVVDDEPHQQDHEEDGVDLGEAEVLVLVQEQRSDAAVGA
jgi:hypothetical protein